MKTRIYIIFLLAAILILSGCSPYEQVEDTIYLQNASVKTSLFQIPIFLNDESSQFIIRPHLSLGKLNSAAGSVGEHTKVNSSGLYQVDTLSDGYREPSGANSFNYKGSNFQIKNNDFTLGLDLDIFFSQKFGLSGGIGFSEVENVSFSNYRVGIALRDHSGITGIRFDAGVAWMETQNDIRSVIVRTTKEWGSSTTESHIIFTRDKDLQHNTAYYLNLGLTLRPPESPIGVFINLGYINQQLLDYEPYSYDEDYYQQIWFPWYNEGEYYQSDLRSEYNAGLLDLSGGVLFNFMPTMKLAAGVKYYTELSENLIPSTVYPFVSLQFGM